MIEEQKNAARNRAGGGKMPYDNYQELEVIDAYIEDIAARFPVIVTLVSPARFFEGRSIKYIKISTTKFQNESKPVIFIDAALHAREWITPPTATYTIKKLVEDRNEPDLLERFDWIILPVANPDGYKNTFTNKRMWRMTRSTYQHLLSERCLGVDGNRNYDFYWNTVGVSSNPCTEIYPGSRPFSDIETLVEIDTLLGMFYKNTFIGWHCTSPCTVSAARYSTLGVTMVPFLITPSQSVGNSMAQAIDQLSLWYFLNYVVGNATLVLRYGVSGCWERTPILLAFLFLISTSCPILGLKLKDSISILDLLSRLAEKLGLELQLEREEQEIITTPNSLPLQ